MTPESEEVLDLDGAAKLLRVDPRTLSKAAKSGEVPHLRIGRNFRFHRTTLLNILTGAIAQPRKRR